MRVTTVLRLERRAMRRLRAAAVLDDAAAAAPPADVHRWLAPLVDAFAAPAAGKECATRS